MSGGEPEGVKLVAEEAPGGWLQSLVYLGGHELNKSSGHSPWGRLVRTLSRQHPLLRVTGRMQLEDPETR